AVSGLVSTWMGDRLGIPGAVSFSFSQREAGRLFPLVWETAAAAAAPAPFESVPGVQKLVRQLRGWGESFRGWPKSFSGEQGSPVVSCSQAPSAAGAAAARGLN